MYGRRGGQICFSGDVIFGAGLCELTVLTLFLISGLRSASVAYPHVSQRLPPLFVDVPAYDRRIRYCMLCRPNWGTPKSEAVRLQRSRGQEAKQTTSFLVPVLWNTRKGARTQQSVNTHPRPHPSFNSRFLTIHRLFVSRELQAAGGLG